MTYDVDPRIDQYIDALPRPGNSRCAREVRDLVHAADPAVVETIKRTVQPYFVLRRQYLRAARRQGPRQCVPLRRRDRPGPGADHHGRPRSTRRPGRYPCARGETINAGAALSAMFVQIIADNRAGGWRALQGG